MLYHSRNNNINKDFQHQIDAISKKKSAIQILFKNLYETKGCKRQTSGISGDTARLESRFSLVHVLQISSVKIATTTNNN